MTPLHPKSRRYWSIVGTISAIAHLLIYIGGIVLGVGCADIDCSYPLSVFAKVLLYYVGGFEEGLLLGAVRFPVSLIAFCLWGALLGMLLVKLYLRIRNRPRTNNVNAL